MKYVTAQREAILAALMRTTSHPSAQWVYEQVKNDVHDIGLATVYRNLRLLRTRGRVLELHTREGMARYDANTSVHYHFHCDRCGRIIDLDEPVDTAVEARVAAHTGLKVTRHSLDVSGLAGTADFTNADADSDVTSNFTAGTSRGVIMRGTAPW